MRTLLHNARILTMNEAFDEHLEGWVLVEDGLIAAMGAGAAPAIYQSAADIVDFAGDLLMPGMVNTHCHMTMTLFRGLGEDVDDRLFRYILPLEREAITAEVVRVGSSLAALEMMLGGVTTVADMYWFEQEVGRVLDAAGMRGVVGQTLADFNPPDQRSFDEGFRLVDDLRDEFAANDLITASIAPHAPYSTGPEIMERVAQYAADNADVKIQMHLAEMKSEMEWCAKHHDMRPVALADRTGILSAGAIMAHCLELNGEEIDLLAERNITVAHNARSNAKAGRGIAPIEALRASGVPVGLATDGPMSGNTLDIFSQLAPASMFAKLLGKSRACLPAREVLTMATIEGAKVLGLDDRIGSIETGKRADLIRISLDAPRMNPIYDIYATLVFSATASDVLDVMIDGQWVVQNKHSQTMDRQKVMSDALQVSEQFKSKIIEIDTEN
ncbi:amidohydrolase family protein [Pseudahrensia aquimaris]|uniref:Amidohydrolase family protein n=1 Tax=Pseudahrensia aquimaris TaxID=744461 RepID=A0ABW3FDV4_9HYPH